MTPIPITIITGFLGSGKTTLILNLIPQLPKDYKLALLKNEFGDLAIDSQLASSSAIGGVQELLNGCICCNLVGQLGDALETLRTEVKPDRIIIETSGSAFPATLAMEVNRLGKESGNYTLDGVIVVIDVENWKGYEDTSVTARMQARYTDLIVFNKWENVSERKYEDCLDRVGDLDLQVANVKSDKGRVNQDLLLGLDSALAKKLSSNTDTHVMNEHVHEHDPNHQSEVEVLSITLSSMTQSPLGVDRDALQRLLSTAPKDEIYRIKAILSASQLPSSSENTTHENFAASNNLDRYILNWAFGRWTFTPLKSALPAAALPTPPQSRDEKQDTDEEDEPVLRMTIILARFEADKWKKRLDVGEFLCLDNKAEQSNLKIQRLV